MKKIIRLTESDLRNIINESVNRIISEMHEEDENDYDPYLNGDASWLDGEYDIPYGYHVEIDTKYGTVSIEDEEGGEESSYFLQGDEADDLIKQICQYWNEHQDLNQEEAVNAVISGLF